MAATKTVKGHVAVAVAVAVHDHDHVHADVDVDVDGDGDGDVNVAVIEPAALPYARGCLAMTAFRRSRSTCV